MKVRSRREHRGIESALYALAFSATLAIGGVHAITQVVLAGAALGLFSFAFLGPLRERGVGIPPLAWIPIAALGWTTLQLVPLPIAVVRVLSPRAAAVREGVTGSFAPLTLDANATTLELTKLLLALCVLLLGAELLRRGSKRASVALAAFGVCIIVILWAHRFSGASHIYGFYAPHAIPGTGLFPPFVNGNNLASVLVLCALAAAGAAFDQSDTRGPLYAAVAFACALSTIGTGSRGGAVGLAVGALFLFTEVASARFGRSRAVLLSIVVTAALITGVGFVATSLRSRFVAPQAGDTLTNTQKTRGWLAAARLANAYPVTGVGRGAFEAPAAEERLNTERVRLVYPENVVLQVVSEWGWPVGLALLGGLVALFVATLRRARIEPALLGLAAGVIAVSVHELADFGLEFPGVLLPTTLALSAIVGSAESADRERVSPRLRGVQLHVALGFGVVVVVAGAFAARHTLSRDLEGVVDGSVALTDAIGRHPASAELEMVAAERASKAHDPSVFHHLNRAMRLEPNGWVHHTLAAAELERLHRYGQAAIEYRLAREHGADLNDAALAQRLGHYALDVEPKSVEAYLRLGAAYATYGKFDDATQAYERAAAITPSARVRAEWLRWLPAERRPQALEAIEHEAQDGDELATAITGWAANGNLPRAEHALSVATERYPSSVAVAVAGARMRLAAGDLDGARRAIGHVSRFDDVSRVRAEEVVIEIAQRSGDLDQVAAETARLHLLRAKAHIPEPTNGGLP